MKFSLILLHMQDLSIIKTYMSNHSKLLLNLIRLNIPHICSSFFFDWWQKRENFKRLEEEELEAE